MENKIALQSQYNLIPYLNEYLNSEVNYERFITSVKYNSNLVDVVEFQNGNINLSSFPVNTWIKKEAYVTFCLGHISTNPQNKENSILLERLYLYSQKGQCPDKKRFCPNLNIKNAELFLDKLINACNNIRDSIEHKERVVPHIFYLEGNRGAGKTVFINHFFSKYNKRLAIEKTIWVRVDLDNGILKLKSSIENYLGNKTLKIILKHYSRHSEYNFDFFIREVKKEINDSDNDFKLELLLEFNKYVNKFHNRNPLIITDSTFSEYLIDIMYNVLKKKEIKIIYIIDNIDLLDKSKSRLEKFHYFIERIQNFVIPNLKENGVFLITYRSNIHNYIEKTIAASSKAYSNYLFILKNMDFDDIFRKKIEVIEKRVNEIGGVKRKNWDLSDWPEQIDDFYEFITSVSDFSSIDEFLNYLDLCYFNNNRSKTQIIQLLYKAFILSYNEKYKYRFIEYLFLAGKSFPPKVFHYKKDEDGNIFLFKTDKIYDNIFVPSLFTYPYAKELLNIELPYSKSYILLKFRIIQFLLIINFYKSDNIEVKDILENLNTKYNYDESFVMKSLDEFCELEFVELVKDEGNFLVSSTGKIVLKSRFFTFFSFIIKEDTEMSNMHQINYTNTPNTHQINFANIIKSLAYLNLSAMRIKVSEDSLKNFNIFNSMPYEFVSKSHKETLEWLKWKIINSITLIKFVAEIESFENENLSYNSESFDKYDNKLISLSDFLIENVLKEVTLIFNKLDSNDKISIQTEIINHFEKTKTNN